MITTLWFIGLITSLVLVLDYSEDHTIDFTWPDGSEQRWNPLPFGLMLVATLFTIVSPF